MDDSLIDARIRECRAAGFWRNEHLDAYVDRGDTTRHDKGAVEDGQGRYTWAALARAVERVAHGLSAHGVERGSVVSCHLPNWSEFALVLLAAARLGAVVNPIPPTYRASELRFMLGLLESHALVIPATFRGFDYRDLASQLMPGLPQLERIFVARGEAPSGMESFSTLTDVAWEDKPGRRSLPGGDPNAVHEVIFTSGTTGEPKGVMHTPNTALAALYPVIERLDFTERDVLLMASTLGHQTGYLYSYCLNLLLGATVVWMDIWNAQAAAAIVETEGVTFTMGATPLRHLGGVGDDGERPGDVQRARRPRGEGLRHGRRAAARDGALRGGRRRRAGARGERGRAARPRSLPVRRLLQASTVHRRRPHEGWLVPDGRPRH